MSVEIELLLRDRPTGRFDKRVRMSVVDIPVQGDTIVLYPGGDMVEYVVEHRVFKDGDETVSVAASKLDTSGLL